MTIVLAKIFGLYFLAIGLAFIINPDRFKSLYRKVMKDEGFLLIGGIVALLIGAVVISVHNVWIREWPVLVTILGWWSFVKGFALLVYPDCIKLFSFMSNRSHLFYRSVSIIYLTIGLFLLYHTRF